MADPIAETPMEQLARERALARWDNEGGSSRFGHYALAAGEGPLPTPAVGLQ